MKSVYTLSLSAIMLALMIVGSKISIPLPMVSLTLQTFMVFLIPQIVGRKNGFIIMLTYMVLGLLGLPIFSTGGGLSYVFTPSFGFIIGFILSQVIICSSDNKAFNLCFRFVALFLIYFVGTIYMYFILNFYLGITSSISYVLMVGVVPFIIKDIISFVLADILAYRLRSTLRYQNAKVFLERK